MKSISPIISTILLIVIVVAIAGILYAFLTGMFTNLSGNTSKQANKLANGITQYVLSSLTYIPQNNSIMFIIYNKGNVPINTSNAIVTLDNIQVNFNCNNNLILPGQQSICYINLPYISNNEILQYSGPIGTTTLNFIYNGITESITGYFNISIEKYNGISNSTTGSKKSTTILYVMG